MWDCSVFTQYSYYCELFCSGPALCLHDCHFHGWVHYIDTTNITVWCMSLLLLSIDLQWFYSFIMFNFNLSHNFYILTSIESIHFGIFKHNLFASDKATHNLRFWIINNKFINQDSVIKPSDNWMMGLCQGFANCCEGDCDSDLNPLASAILVNKLL